MTTKSRNAINYIHQLHDRQNKNHESKRVLYCLYKHMELTVDNEGRFTADLDSVRRLCVRCRQYRFCLDVIAARERNTY